MPCVGGIKPYDLNQVRCDLGDVAFRPATTELVDVEELTDTPVTVGFGG
jgi:hypothetical protein